MSFNTLSAVRAENAGDAAASSRKFFFGQNLGKLGQNLSKIGQS